METRILGKRKPLVTIDDFVARYRVPDYRCDRSIRLLARRGDLPLQYTSPNLGDINILVAWLLWSGSITRYQAEISVEPEHQEGIREVGERLKINMVGRKNGLLLGEGGRLYSRLCILLGVPNSDGTMKDRDSKVKQKIELPNYVRFLIDKYAKLRRSDRAIANKILADQCKVLLFSRLKECNGTYELRTISSRNKEDAERLAKQVVMMFNAVYPKMGLEETVIGGFYMNRRRNYTASIRFRSATVSKGADYYGLFRLTINPEYHVMGRRITQKKNDFPFINLS